jgi:DNA-binding transcriptional MerR regulator
VSARSYLSIGDVLTLLRQEFPDVTISKIRFLESQGLVNPERTPSGYRKFYEHDVERLRWVLRQQREHFLPLKVIKGRLDDDANGTAPATTAEASASVADEDGPAATADVHHVEEPVLVGHRASAPGGAPGGEALTAGDASATAPDDRSTLPGIEAATPTTSVAARSNLTPTLGGSPPAPTTVRSTTPAPTHQAPASGHSTERTSPVAAADKRRSPAKPTPAPPPGPTGPPTPPVAAVDPAPAPPGPPPAAPPGRGRARAEAAAAPVDRDPSTPSVDLSGASLSVDELAAACGLEVVAIRELEEYGLVTATKVAGLEYFDEEALAVANLAGQFARFGIEPRHLRLYKNAADREAGFVEQIVIPLVRQRNPDARARAQGTADELTRLGQQLRGSLLRSALADLLKG